jgi:AcrR family transcriptional regulator
MLALVPKLWVETIAEHHREVRDAILGTTAALVAKRGVAGVTMSQIAQETGIGRATLYKYFSDVGAILDAWHDRHVDAHLDRLVEVRDRYADPGKRLKAVLETFAFISRERSRGHEPEAQHGQAGTRAGRSHGAPHTQTHGPHGSEISTLVHRSEHVAAAQARLTRFFRDVIADAVSAGDVRDDIPAEELATFCVHALLAATAMRSKLAVPRVVAMTLAGLRRRRR